jgi:hypothetical protein
MKRVILFFMAIVALAAAFGIVVLAGSAKPSVAGSFDPGQVAAGGGPSFAAPSPLSAPSQPAGEAPIASPAPSASAAPSVATPTPVPGPVVVPAPLDGVLVSPEAAARHPIAVMVDDLYPARPQSGFSHASVVWQAPAEGGIPRYMLVFQEDIPELVGPVRSARSYYIAWAAELHAVYAHAGGSPQALRTLRDQGSGQLVYNADEFHFGNTYWRVRDRLSPHNLYTDGEHLRALVPSVGAADQEVESAWSFAPDLTAAHRPRGGRIDFAYTANHIRYDYDWRTNTYLRSVTGEMEQVDASNGARVAPKNVVVMLMRFGALQDGSAKGRLEADVIGQGTAWIATNGRTIVGTWRKASLTAPTQFFDSHGRQVILTIGQTFINVLETGSIVIVEAGAPPPPAPFSGALHRN